MPVAAWMAFVTAGASGGTHGSPRPPSGASDRTKAVVTVGASFARSVVEHTVTTVEGLEGKTAQQANSGGAYADLGAAWLVTPHLSLGAAWTADVSYKRASTDASGEGVQLLDQRVRSWNANAGSVSLRLNLYF